MGLYYYYLPAIYEYLVKTKKSLKPEFWGWCPKDNHDLDRDLTLCKSFEIVKIQGGHLDKNPTNSP